MPNRPYDESKFVEFVLYVAERLRDSPAGGATKLNKSLWYSEIEHLRRYGTTITGADYQKLERGPAPRRLLPVREELVAKGQATVVKSRLGRHTEDRLVPQREPDMSAFSESELATINLVLDRLEPMSGAEVSDLSHEEPAWYLPDMFETIEPELAYLRPAVVNQEVRNRARAIAANRGLRPD
jgi:hypothetical protein